MNIKEGYKLLDEIVSAARGEDSLESCPVWSWCKKCNCSETKCEEQRTNFAELSALSEMLKTFEDMGITMETGWPRTQASTGGLL